MRTRKYHRELFDLARLIALVALAPPQAFAQSPADRSTLGALRDSLGRMSDVRAMSALLAESKQSSRKDDLPSLLRTAAIEARLGTLTRDREPLDASLRVIESALRIDRGSAEAWHALAASKLALHAGGFPAKEGPFQPIGVSHLAGAVQALVRATELDPAFLDAMLLLTRSVLGEPGAAQQDALRALRAATDGPLAHVPDIHLARGLLERELGNDPGAAASFVRFVDAGGDRGLGRLELARTLFAAGPSAAAEAAYYDGAAAASADAADRYRADLAWIATGAELAAFDSLSGSARAGWLRNFWERRDDRAGRRRGERLAEHYRRLAHAVRSFRRIGPAAPGNSPGSGIRSMSGHRIVDETGGETEESLGAREVGRTAGELGAEELPGADIYARLNARTLLRAFHSGQALVDDRGVIYIRHGEPQQRASYAGPQADANESWKYVTPQGELIFHFVGTIAATELVEQLPLYAPMMAARGGLDPRYERLAADLAKGRTLQVRQELLHADRTQGRAAIGIGTSTESHVLRFERSFAPVVQVFGVAEGLDGVSQLLVVFAIPARAIVAGQPSEGRLRLYPVAMRVVAEESASGAIVRLDTTRVFVSRSALDPDAWLSGQIRVPVPPGRYTVRVILSDTAAAAGAAVGHMDVPVPRLGAAEPTMSDLVLGRENSGQRWIAGADTVELNPLNAYPSGSSLEVFYQLGGLPVGAMLRTSIAVRPRSDRGGRRRVAVRFDERVSAARLAVHRSVALASLPPGEYLIIVAIGEVDRPAAIERRQVLTVVR
jgi:GWxTD domain-containing protein